MVYGCFTSTIRYFIYEHFSWAEQSVGLRHTYGVQPLYVNHTAYAYLIPSLVYLLLSIEVATITQNLDS